MAAEDLQKMRPTKIQSFLIMPEETQPEAKMIGYEMLANMSDKERAQEIWDRAMSPEAHAYMERLYAWKAGLGPEPEDYNGPVIDFEKAAADLDREDPQPRSRE
jgi:hypothetical protein